MFGASRTPDRSCDPARSSARRATYHAIMDGHRVALGLLLSALALTPRAYADSTVPAPRPGWISACAARLETARQRLVRSIPALRSVRTTVEHDDQGWHVHWTASWHVRDAEWDGHAQATFDEYPDSKPGPDWYVFHSECMSEIEEL